MARKDREKEDDPWLYVVFRDRGIEVELHPTKWTEIGARNLERAIRQIRRQRMALRKQAIMGGKEYARRFQESGVATSEGVVGHVGQDGAGTERPGGGTESVS